MKKIFLFIILSLSIQCIVSRQNIDSKKYQINKLDTQVIYSKKEVNFQIYNTITEELNLDQNAQNKEGTILNELNMKNNYVDVYDGNRIKRLTKHGSLEFSYTRHGKKMTSKSEDQLTGKTIIFQREKNNWEVPEFNTYNSSQQKELTTYLIALNKGNSNRVADFIYPDYMQIGDTIVLEKRHINNFFDLHTVEFVEGKLILNTVMDKDEEKIAVFDVDLKIKGTNEKDTLFLDLKGTLKRSISKFYDKETDVSGKIIFQTNEKNLTMKASSTFFMTRTLD